MTQQHQVTGSIANSLQDAAGWTSDLSRVVENLAGAVARTREAAHKVEFASQETGTAAGKLQHLVDKFLHKVAAA